ncbi:Assembly-complementing factor 4 [Nakaseomyces bracarensis]|uniref:Assembly-complementing factor 4 n=1 Tax=Nakaseomyces bracarensis TaxID=273131 RepID=A0ABR4NQ25_9SACH
MAERMVSNPIELQKLSLVDRQKQRSNDAKESVLTKSTGATNTKTNANAGVNSDGNETTTNAGEDTPKHRTRPVVPIASPRKSAEPVPELPADDEHSELLKLASKQREIFELEQKLKQAKLELKQMEEDVGRRLGLTNGSQQEGLKSMLQKRLEEVNRSPNVIRTKKSVSNLIQRGNALLGDSQPPVPSRQGNNYNPGHHENGPYRSTNDRTGQQKQQSSQQPHLPPRQPPRPQGHSQHVQSQPSRPVQTRPPRDGEQKRRPQSSFFNKIIDKFHEMNQEEADFDSHRDARKDKYYIGEAYGYDDEIEDEDEPGEPLEHINDMPTTLFKR